MPAPSARPVFGVMPTPTTTASAGTVSPDFVTTPVTDVSPSMRSTPSPNRNSTPWPRCRSANQPPDLLPHDAEQRRGLRLDDGDRAARVTGGRGDLEADPAGADDDDAGALAEARLERLGLLHLAQVEHPVEVGARHVEGAGGRAGREEQLFVGEGFAARRASACAARRRGRWPGCRGAARRPARRTSRGRG